jgi:hypothetical protein
VIEPTFAFTLFDKVFAGPGLLLEGKRQRTQKIDQALLALYAALAESRAYIIDRESGKRRNREREVAIAKLWHMASVPLRAIDVDFAERCFMKGGYWLGPETWNKKQIHEKGIAIESMFEATRKLLTSSKPSQWYVRD